MKILKKIKYPLTVIVLFIILLVVIYIKSLLNNNKYQEIDFELDKNIELPENKEETQCTIDIKGAVTNPGVYLLDCNSTVNDAINAAGNLTQNADTSVINLAKKIYNEMVIIIYTKEEVKNSNIVETVVKTVENECVCPNIQNDACINTEIKDNIDTNLNKLININTATIEELKSIPGIGESKAKAIIKYREEVNKFNDIEDIKNVEGIGSKLYEEIKVYITA